MLFGKSSSAQAEKIGIGLPHGIKNLNPLQNDSLEAKAVYASLASRLTTLNSDGSTSLDVANSLRSVNGSRDWYVSIPENLSFPSGRTLSLEELKNSMLLFRDKYRESLPADELRRKLNNIKDILVEVRREKVGYRVLDKKFLRFQLHQSEQEFDRVLAQMPIIESSLWSEFGQFAGSGTLVPVFGPYIVEQNDETEVTQLKSNQHFFKAGIPRSSSVRFVPFEDDISALRALRVGSIDILLVSTPEILKKAEMDRSLRVLSSPLCPEENSCRLSSDHWGKNPLAGNKIISDKIIVRSSLELNEQFRGRLDVSGLYWSNTASLSQ